MFSLKPKNILPTWENYFAILLISASAVSFLATGGAIFFFLVEKQSFALALAAAGLISGLIQFAIAGFWFATHNPRLPLMLRVACLAFGLAFSLISGALASASWSLTFFASDVEDIIDKKNWSTISKPLLQAQYAMEEASNQVGRIAAISAEKMTVETEHGASCDGPAVATGPGSRFHLREQMRVEAQLYSQQFSALASKAATVSRLGSDVDQQLIDQRFATAKELFRAPVISGFKTWAEQHIEGFSENSGFTNASGRTFTCLDGAMAAALRDAVASLPHNDLPATAPVAAEVDFSIAALEAVNQIFLLLSGKAMSPVYTPAVTIAFVTEILIVILIVLTEALRRANSFGVPRGNVLRGTRLASIKRTHTLLNQHIMALKNRDVLLVPLSEGAPREVLGKLAADLSLPRLPVNINMPIVSPYHYGILQARGVNEDVFDVYVVNKRLFAMRKAISADLEASSG